MSATSTLEARHKAAVPRGVATKDLYIARAENAELWDVNGKRYIDFAAGIAVLNTGHRHPDVMAAVRAQTEAFTHTCFHVAPYESYIGLAERLNRMTPGSFEKKTMLVTTGAEAVENAIKIARSATGRSAIIAFSGGFHGRTMMGMALTGKVAPYKKGFGPFPAEVYQLNDLGHVTRRPIEIVNWTNEEGARFSPPMLASGCFAGTYTVDWVHGCPADDGVTFGEEPRRIGARGQAHSGRLFRTTHRAGTDPRCREGAGRRRHPRLSLARAPCRVSWRDGPYRPLADGEAAQCPGSRRAASRRRR